MPVLHVEGLHYSRPALADRDGGFALVVEQLVLDAGQAIGVVGPSGCGKSTLVDLLALLRRPSGLRRFELMREDAAALWQSGAMDGCTRLRARHVGVVL